MLEAISSRSPLAAGTLPVSEFLAFGIALPDRTTNPLRRNYEYMLEFDPAECAPETAAYLREVEATVGAPMTGGGAATFLEILTGEILPVVERHYRVDRRRRMLFGHSAGGTFACHTLFTRPDAFTDYALGSPGSFGRELVRLEEQWASHHDDLCASVSIRAGLGELTDPLLTVSNTARLVEKLHAHLPESRVGRGAVARRQPRPGAAVTARARSVGPAPAEHLSTCRWTAGIDHPG